MEYNEDEQAWRQQANCSGADVNQFFPEKHQGHTLAVKYVKQQICGTCAVRKECLEFGMSEDHGIFGGLTVRQRNELKWRRNRGRRMDLS